MSESATGPSTKPGFDIGELRQAESVTMTVPEAAEWLQVSVATAYRMAREGSLPTIRSGRVIRIPTASFLRLVGLDPDACVCASRTTAPSSSRSSSASSTTNAATPRDRAMPARPSYMKEKDMKEKDMNAFCLTCDSWVPGGDDERDEDGGLVRNEYGNRLRKMECGHEIPVEEFDPDEFPGYEGR
jgi:excisionase family DNA binding protein